MAGLPSSPDKLLPEPSPRPLPARPPRGPCRGQPRTHTKGWSKIRTLDARPHSLSGQSIPFSAAVDTRRSGSAPASARDDAQASCTAMFQSSRRPLFKNAAERGALAAGGGRGQTTPHNSPGWGLSLKGLSLSRFPPCTFQMVTLLLRLRLHLLFCNVEHFPSSREVRDLF